MSEANDGNGISFLGAMFLIFLTLKLTNVISWSWWYVTLPLWGGIALGLTVLSIVATIFKVSTLAEEKRRINRE